MRSAILNCMAAKARSFCLRCQRLFIVAPEEKDGPQDLVFQSLRKGAPMRDGNILRRHLRPAALKLGIDPRKAIWRSLRTSCATWMIEAGANPKDTQSCCKLRL
jgi:hypothetical protein